jgi:predicted dehydrogenase
VVDDPTIDAVVIGTWPYMHRAVTLAALRAGKHVLCEARMAMDAAEAREMLASARDHPELITQIVPSPLTLRWDRTIRRVLGEGDLGRLVSQGRLAQKHTQRARAPGPSYSPRLSDSCLQVHVDVRGVSGKHVDASAPLHWRQSVELSGVNTMTLGIFYEAVRRWVGDATRVTAMATSVVQVRRADGAVPGSSNGTLEAVGVPDHLEVLGRLAMDGAQLHMLISDVVAGAGRPRAEVWLHGTQADLHLDITHARLTLHHPSEASGGRDVGVEVCVGERDRERERELALLSALLHH